MSPLEKLSRFALSQIESLPIKDRPAILREAALHVPHEVASIAISTARLIDELDRHQLELFAAANK